MNNGFTPDFTAVGEVLFVPNATRATLTSLKRFDTFRFWNHAMLLRRYTGAAEIAGSLGQVTGIEFETSDLALQKRCRELRHEAEAGTVERFPQIAS